MKTYLVVFVTIFLAELGDKTQLATLVFATNPDVSRLGVFVAAAAALVTSSLLAVLIGSELDRWVAPAHVRLVAAISFIVLGTWMIVTAKPID